MSWTDCKNILVIRADNIGDLIMSSPAIRAVKEYLDCKITLLASAAVAPAISMISSIDDTIIAELPWVKKDSSFDPQQVKQLVEELKRRRFDGCIVFTVYSQSALPAAMISWMAGIPLRLSYSRENPYELLTDWLPDREPYSFIRHQVERDIALVNFIGIPCRNDRIMLSIGDKTLESMEVKAASSGLNTGKPYILFHAAVSEPKRLFPAERWALLIRSTVHSFDLPVCLTGSERDRELNDDLQRRSGNLALSMTGTMSIPELAGLVKKASLVVSINTGVVHIASGVNTPVVVLYARTNPQHTPWRISNKVLEYSVPEELKSRNEVIRYVDNTVYRQFVPYPDTMEIIKAMKAVIRQPVAYPA